MGGEAQCGAEAPRGRVLALSATALRPSVVALGCAVEASASRGAQQARRSSAHVEVL